jgi:hypothetical protein
VNNQIQTHLVLSQIFGQSSATVRQQQYSAWKTNLARINHKNPSILRRLAQDNKAKTQIKRVFLAEFKTHQITTQELAQNKEQLADALERFYRIRSHRFEPREYNVRRGQTLQIISRELYATTRRWPELYLLNHQQMTDWNSLAANQSLRYFLERPKASEGLNILQRNAGSSEGDAPAGF